MRKKRSDKKQFGKENMMPPSDSDFEKLEQMEDEYDESKRLKYIAMIFVIPLFFFINYIFQSKYNNPKNEAKIEEIKAQKEATKKEINILEADRITQDADDAFEKKDFIKAIFLYRQAISYKKKDVTLHEKLLVALEESCKVDEDSFHCEAIEKTKNKIKFFKGEN